MCGIAASPAPAFTARIRPCQWSVRAAESFCSRLHAARTRERQECLRPSHANVLMRAVCIFASQTRNLSTARLRPTWRVPLREERLDATVDAEWVTLAGRGQASDDRKGGKNDAARGPASGWACHSRSVKRYDSQLADAIVDESAHLVRHQACLGIDHLHRYRLGLELFQDKFEPPVCSVR